MLPLDNLKLRDVGTHGVFSSKPTFALFNVEGRYNFFCSDPLSGHSFVLSCFVKVSFCCKMS